MALTAFATILIVSVTLASCKSISSEENSIERLSETNCSCDWRYFKHYEVKGCVPDKVDECGCPQNFVCSSNQTQQAPLKVCVYQNKEYKVGAKIITPDTCQVCRCHRGYPPYIGCVTRECPRIPEYGDEFRSGCHHVYRGNKCCPAGIECFENEATITNNETCQYDGKYYPFGSRIYPADDPCLTCVCDENWTGVNNVSCYQQQCMLERSKSMLDAGCIPVYHESRCCPIEFYCPSSHDFNYAVLPNNESSAGLNISNASSPDFNYAVLSNNESSAGVSISNDTQCTFGEQYYAVGEELDINNPCVKCVCTVPPDFTCVHQSCSPAPSQNCYAMYTAGECCPSYECMVGDAEPVTDTEDCPTPLCADSTCRIEIPPGHECPTCVCGPRMSELEHNDLEQQVQQISQTMDQFEQVQQVPQTTHVEDSSEDELRLMPMQMQESDGQDPVLEKMILLSAEDNNQYTEISEELQNISEENIIGSETDTVSDNIQNGLENFTSVGELEENNNFEGSDENESNKVIQKRSGVVTSVNDQQIQEIPVEQDQDMSESNEDIEREGENPGGSNEDFDDELKRFKNKIFDKNKTIINEVININHLVEVPPGCPTPMCEGPWCKIGIKPGEKCPTCICKRHDDP